MQEVVRHVLLGQPIQVAGHEQPVVSASAIAYVEEIDLLLVDGRLGTRKDLLATPPCQPCAISCALEQQSLDDCHRGTRRRRCASGSLRSPGCRLSARSTILPW